MKRFTASGSYETLTGEARKNGPLKDSAQKAEVLNGFLLADKPEGLTSHDVVARVKRIAKPSGCGHTGTLDPLATGLLVILVGAATKLAPYLPGEDKTYLAGIRLGLLTDTLDITGRTISERTRGFPGPEAVLSRLSDLAGTALQKPPLYSAIKVKGKPAYKAAREGQEIELPPREVTAHSLELISYDPPMATIRAHVSKGYYVRALARDLGAALGLDGGCLTSLRRLSAGEFKIEGAGPIPESRQELAARLLSPREALAHMPELFVTEAQASALCHGAKLSFPSGLPPGPPRGPAAAPGVCKIIAPGGCLVAIGQITIPDGGSLSGTPDGPFLRPLRVLTPAL